MQTIKVTVEKTRTGYSAYTEDYLGVASVGSTRQELQDNFAEAIALHFEGMKADNEPVPEEYRLVFGWG